MAAIEDESISPKTRKQWRSWLQKNHDKKEAVWLIFYKKGSETPTISRSDSVDEALCFGWIDSLQQPIDGEKFRQRFSRRKPNSTWSKVNKQKIERLIAEERMTQAGLQVIDAAKKNGSWKILDEVEELIIPKDLDRALKGSRGSKKRFISISRSKRRLLLLGLVLAKRPETRSRRIAEIIELVSHES